MTAKVNPNKAFSSPQYAYAYNLSSYIKVTSGDVKAIYLAYSDFDQPISEANIHKVSYTDWTPELSDQLSTILPDYVGQFFPSRGKEKIINFTHKIQYQRTKKAADKEKDFPIYVILVDMQNNINIDVVTTQPLPYSQQKLDPSLAYFTISAEKSEDRRYQSVHFFTAQEIFESQDSENKKSLLISPGKYKKDTREIRSLITQYFVK